MMIVLFHQTEDDVKPRALTIREKSQIAKVYGNKELPLRHLEVLSQLIDCPIKKAYAESLIEKRVEEEKEATEQAAMVECYLYMSSAALDNLIKRKVRGVHIAAAKEAYAIVVQREEEQKKAAAAAAAAATAAAIAAAAVTPAASTPAAPNSAAAAPAAALASPAPAAAPVSAAAVASSLLAAEGAATSVKVGAVTASNKKPRRSRKRSPPVKEEDASCTRNDLRSLQVKLLLRKVG
jgi:hypothetical protein